MPKINVYLPDDLAEMVKETSVPVSVICQRALEQAVRRVTAVRAAAVGKANAEDTLAQLSRFTSRARDVVELAIEQARTQDTPSVDTGHLLGGILDEGGSLAVHVLRGLDIDPDQLRDELIRQSASEPSRVGGSDGSLPFSIPAAKVLELSAAEAISLDNNYIGCEHLLLGLAVEPDGVAGNVLRGQAADHRALRRAVVAAIGVHLRAQAQQDGLLTPEAAEPQLIDVMRQQLAPIIGRLARLEQHVGISGDDGASPQL